MRQFGAVPQIANQELLLPEQFPPVPDSIRARFGQEAAAWGDSIQSFWTHARRALQDLHTETAQPLNRVTEEVRLPSLLAGSLTLGAFVEQIATAGRTTDGYLAAQYTLNVVAGNVITGIRLMSVDGPEGTISDITLLTDTFRVVSSSAPSVQLVFLNADGFVFGTDILSDNFVAGSAGWRLTKAGNFEANDGTFRGALAANTGVIGGFTLGATSFSTGAAGAYAALSAGATPLLAFGVGAVNRIEIDANGLRWYAGGGLIANIGSPGIQIEDNITIVGGVKTAGLVPLIVTGWSAPIFYTATDFLEFQAAAGQIFGRINGGATILLG